MSLERKRNAVVAAVGAGALVVCILACTSFSPDDKKILYPTFDPATRSMGVAVYDRAAKTSELLLVSRGLNEAGEADTPMIMRANWLPDGKRVAVTWLPLEEDKEDKSVVSFAVLTLEGKEPLRLLHLKDVEYGGVISYPLPIVGNRVYVNSDSNTLTSLDLVTGQCRLHTNPEQLAVYVSPVPDRLGFLAKVGADKLECGLLNPATMTKEWRMELEEDTACNCFFAFSPAGRKVVFTPEENAEPVLKLYEEGKPPKPVPVPRAKEEELTLGQVAFSKDGNALLAAFRLKTEGRKGQSLGIVEVPLDGNPARRTVLIKEAELEHDQTLQFFQFGLSHDGKALAVSSAYVAAANPDLGAEDCALFILDLADPNRKVTKVAIPRPFDCGRIGK